MVRIFFFLLGFCLLVFGISYIIMCLNVISIGYNFLLMVNFICSGIYIYLIIIGFLMILFSIMLKGDKRR